MSGTRGLPPGPLLELLAARAAEATTTVRAFTRDRFGHNADRTLARWRAGGSVRRDLADEVCTRLGVNPLEVWPHDWERVAQTPPRSRRSPVPAEPWQEQAACRNADPDIFFPKRGESLAVARAICSTCPSFDPCWEVGLMQKFGVWAGTSERERHQLRRRLRIHIPDDDLIDDDTDDFRETA